MFTTPPLDDLRGRIKPTSLGHEAGEADAPPLDAKDDPHEQPIVDEIRIDFWDLWTADQQGRLLRVSRVDGLN